MPMFIDTRGKSKIAIGICGRCSRKFAYVDLVEDPNIPGLWVCPEDRDQFDPWRLPARQTEDISLDHPRPDVAISEQGPTPLYGTNQLNPVVLGRSVVPGGPITSLRPPQQWQPRTFYRKGDTLVPNDPNSPETTLPQPWFVVLEDGWSGDTPPNWPQKTGVYYEAPI